MAEITDASNTAIAFPVYGLCWPVGSIIGYASFAITRACTDRLFPQTPNWGDVFTSSKTFHCIQADAVFHDIPLRSSVYYLRCHSFGRGSVGLLLSRRSASINLVDMYVCSFVFGIDPP